MKKKIALVLTMAMLDPVWQDAVRMQQTTVHLQNRKKAQRLHSPRKRRKVQKQGRRNGSVPMTARPLRFVCGAAYSRNMDTMKCAQTLMSSTKTRAYR